jgi:hypothetical protein
LTSNGKFSAAPSPEIKSPEALLYLAQQALMEAEAQIEYLHEKFKPTGSGANALCRIDIALTAINHWFAAQAGVPK